MSPQAPEKKFLLVFSFSESFLKRHQLSARGWHEALVLLLSLSGRVVRKGVVGDVRRRISSARLPFAPPPARGGTESETSTGGVAEPHAGLQDLEARFGRIPVSILYGEG